jgi:RraA family protein
VADFDAAPVRVNPAVSPPVDADTVGRLARASAALVVDQDEDDCLFLPAGLHPLGSRPENTFLCGPAFTVNARPGDNVAVRLGIDRAAPGQVLVIAGRADRSRALIGEIMARKAAARGIAGFVIEGAVRDAASIGELDIPVFCLGSALKRATKYGHGDVGYPIAIANEVVYPGDVIVADSDGIAVVRRAGAAAVAMKIEAALAYEADRMRSADAGTLDLGVSGLAAS